MADPSPLSYVGAITGAIGAVTGIAGMVLGIVSLRRSSQNKALDLRLELRRAVFDLATAVGRLGLQIQQAKASRSAVAAALGQRGSGIFQVWENEWATDEAAANALALQVPDTNDGFAGATMLELEAKLVEVHAHQTAANRLKAKYESALAEDDRSREQIRQSANARVNASLRK